MMSEPIVKKFSCFLSKDFATQLALKKFDLSLVDLEKVVGRYKSGKFTGSLRGKITWWKIETGGYINDTVVSEKGLSFCYRIVDYNEEIVHFGARLTKSKSWFDDYLDYKESLLTEEQKTKRNQEEYKRQKNERSIKMIDSFFKAETTKNSIEKFSSGLIKADREVKDHFLKKVSSYSFNINEHSFFEKIKLLIGEGNNTAENILSH